MKEKFLKDLEKKLSPLSSDEVKDILNEYNDIIDEKIKHGKTEEEAIKEFGDIKELSKEILKTYKINPDYKTNNFSEKTNEFIKNGEEFIKQGAQKLTDVTEEIVDSFKENNAESNLTMIFEIIIKVFLVLVALAILRIPFIILEDVGIGVFEIFPLSNIYSGFWKALIWIIYIVVCIIIALYIVNKYIKKESVCTKDKCKEKEIKEEKINKVKEEKINKVKEEKNQSRDTLGNAIVILIKIWSVILFLIPIFCIEMALVIAICVAIYLIFKGIEIYGILILLIGIAGLFGFFSNIIFKLLFEKRKIHIFSLFFNFILIIVGGLLTFDYFTDFKYINSLPDRYKEINSTYEITINEKTYIDDIIEKNIDNTLQDNQLKIVVTYYNDIYEIEEPIIVNNHIPTIKHFNKKEIEFDGKYTKDIIKDLKDKKIYNYSLMDDIKIKVYSNETTSNLYE